MNKILYNILLAISIATLLAACSSSDDNYSSPDAPDPTWSDPSAKYVKYAQNAQSMGYAGRVKSVEKTTYKEASIDLTTNTITKGRSYKEVFYFDANGALIKQTMPANYSENSSSNYTETTYVYDSLYREVESVQYNSSDYSYYIAKTEYNDTKKTATLTYYKRSYGSTVIDYQSKFEYKLDNEGRLSSDDIDIFYPTSYNYGKSITPKNSEADYTINYTRKVERDSKNNILSEYIISNNTSYETSNKHVELKNYADYTITYYDGTVSKPSDNAQNETFSVESTLTSWFKGNVKSVKMKAFSSTKNSPISQNDVTGGDISLETEYEFDSNKYLIKRSQTFYSPYTIYAKGELQEETYYKYKKEATEYELDAKNRVKTAYKTITNYKYNFYYNNAYGDYYLDIKNPTSTDFRRKTVYIYDDVNNTVTEETYENYDGSASALSNNNLKTAETRDSYFGNTPTKNQKKVEKKDANGNDILSYYLISNYNDSGVATSQLITEYVISEITYY